VHVKNVIAMLERTIPIKDGRHVQHCCSVYTNNVLLCTVQLQLYTMSCLWLQWQLCNG